MSVEQRLADVGSQVPFSTHQTVETGKQRTRGVGQNSGTQALPCTARVTVLEDNLVSCIHAFKNACRLTQPFFWEFSSR